MKTKNLIKSISLTFLLFTLFSHTYADNNKTSKSSKLKSYLEKQLIFSYSPESAQEKGLVAVDFTVDEEGKLAVNQMNYSDKYLKELVLKKLENLRIAGADEYVGQNYIYKFEFINE